jgi:4-diphosphocytidyl-2-C-methyl-D-erythritol kinase
MSRQCLRIKAPAKINLFLQVVGRRSDGYHLLNTFMQKVSLYDEVELCVHDEGIRLRCVGGEVPESNDNLVYRAAELFLQTMRGRASGWKTGVDIILTKKIPVAAGLGGGSSDAAATLKGLNELCRCGCSAGELAEFGVRLGADVPFFLAETPAALATGIGEILQPVEPLDEKGVLLVNPGFPVSTRWVYQNFALTRKENSGNLQNLQEVVSMGAGDDGNWREDPKEAILLNDLESVTVARYPEIGRLKKELIDNGATAALMSGSGPTVFGLFDDLESAAACQELFKRRFKHVYLVSPIGD